MKTIAILGTGQVGKALKTGFEQHGYAVVVGSRETGFADAAAKGDIVVLAVKGSAAEEVVKQSASALAGKTVIDTTNPISDKPAEQGIIHYFTTLEDSLMERLQKAAPDAHFVKAFNSVGNAHMVNPQFESKPTMFICGDNADAKKETTEILDQFGWETADMGGVMAARAIEPLCILWCIPGMLHNEWSHAFKLLKK